MATQSLVPSRSRQSEESALELFDDIPSFPKATSRSPLHKPALSSIISVHDFRDVARQHFNEKTWAFYSSAATDEYSHQMNLSCNRKLLLRPRVLRNVKNASTTRSILGCSTSAPFFVSPAAMNALAHPEGEKAVARACGNAGIAMTVSSNSSFPLADIVGSGRPGQPFFLQLYVNRDRPKSEALLRQAKQLGMKAVLLTVDAPVPGKREADERMNATNDFAPAVSRTATKAARGLGATAGSYIDPALDWSDLAWIKKVSGLPLIVKGVQSAADARKAVEHGVDGIMLSNHGGRSLDTVQPAMLTLLELHKHFPEVFDGTVEIYIDGGFTRGTDILKAIALGATAVGIGRPVLFSLSYGQEGVEHLFEILKDELVTGMKLSGITEVEQAHPGMVNTAMLEPLIRGGEQHDWIQWRPKAKL